MEHAGVSFALTSNFKAFFTKNWRPSWWSRGNVVVFHPRGPSSIPGRVGFLVDFSGFSLNYKKTLEI